MRLHLRARHAQLQTRRARSLAEVETAAALLYRCCGGHASSGQLRLKCSIRHTALSHVANSHLCLRYARPLAAYFGLPLSAAVHSQAPVRSSLRDYALVGAETRCVIGEWGALTRRLISGGGHATCVLCSVGVNNCGYRARAIRLGLRLAFLLRSGCCGTAGEPNGGRWLESCK